MFDDEIIFDVPAGGLAFWIRFKTQVNLEKLIDIARTLNLRILPSNLFYSDGSMPDGLRPGYANLHNGEICEAVERLYKAYLLAKKNG